MVTHDFSEARYLAQKIAIINQGCLQQTGDIEDIFQRPTTPFVARFVGMHNLFEARFNGREAKVSAHTLILPATSEKKKGHLAFRPEDVVVQSIFSEGDANNHLRGVVESILHQGAFSEIRIQSKRLHFRALTPTSQVIQMGLSPGESVICSISPDALHTI
jgi:molybdate/tungstate transport system ATP-binding protein